MDDSTEVAAIKSEIAKLHARSAEIRSVLAEMDVRHAKRQEQLAKLHWQVAEAKDRAEQLRRTEEELRQVKLDFDAHQRGVQLETPPRDWLPNEDDHDARGADLLDDFCDEVVMHTYRLRKNILGWWPKVDDVITAFARDTA